MRKPFLSTVIFIISISLGACQSDMTASAATDTPEATAAPMETATITPTATIEPTPTPNGRIFYDGFSGELDSGWTWINEDDSAWNITSDGWLQIEAGDDSLLHGGNQKNLLVRDAPIEKSFVVETRVRADTVSNFQQAALFVFQDSSNFLNINRAYCDLCPAKGDGLFSDYIYQGKWDSYNGEAIDVDEIYLRIDVDREMNQIVTSYSFDGENWTQQRSVPLDLDIQQIGLGVTNSDSYDLDGNLTAQFDYVEVKELE